jgi:hypothetical protein
MVFFDRYILVDQIIWPAKTQKTNLTWAMMFILSMIGLVGITVLTHLGIGISPDSIAYVGGARSLLTGYGFSFPASDNTYTPITHFAPLYSIILSAVGVLGKDPMVAARWVNALLFGANIYFIGFMVSSLRYKASRKIDYLAVVASLLMLVSATMVEIHIMAWTEPIFILLSLLGIYLLAAYFEKSRPGILILSAIVISLATLSRYIGVALVVSGVIGLMLFSPFNTKKRIFDILLFLLLSTSPLILWLVRNQLVAGTATSRELSIHLISKAHIEVAITTLSSWFLIPASASAYVKVIPLLLLTLGFIGILLQNNASGKKFVVDFSRIPPMIKLLVLLIVFYGLFLVISISFLDANTPLDARILSPVFVSGMVVTFYIVGELITWVSRHSQKGNLVHFTVLAISGIFIFSYLSAAINIADRSYQLGIGYNDLAWKNSKTLAEVRKLAKGINIYTNSTEAIYIGTGRIAKSIPKKFESMSQTKNLNYLHEVLVMYQEIQDEGGVLVYFDRVKRPTLPDMPELLSLVDLQLISSLEDGDIYAAQARE